MNSHKYDGKEKPPSTNFVEPSVNKALQQARQIVTQGKADSNANEHVIEDSTSVQVINFV